jgi:hypothetical protein
VTSTVRAVVVLLVAAAVVVVSAPGPATAVAGLESGYWWQAQPDGAPVPPPPQVPPQGLWVSGTPDVEQAISAVRFQLGANEGNPVLTLKVHSKTPPEQLTQAANAGVAVVLACPATKNWTPASAGAWSSRPDGDCGAAAHGTLNGDATAVAFDLSSVVRSGRVDVVLVPGAGGGAPLPNPATLPGGPAPPQPSSGFDITFEPVALSQVIVGPGSGQTESASPVPEPLAPDSTPAPDLSTPVAPASDFNFANTSVNPTAGVAAAPAPSPAAAGIAPQLRALPAGTGSTIGENHGYRALAVILLAALFLWAWRQAVPPHPDRRTIYDGPPAPS